jgi:hypothetical protein
MDGNKKEKNNENNKGFFKSVLILIKNKLKFISIYPNKN